jgi:hypothetical protein
MANILVWRDKLIPLIDEKKSWLVLHCSFPLAHIGFSVVLSACVLREPVHPMQGCRRIGRGITIADGKGFYLSLIVGRRWFLIVPRPYSILFLVGGLEPGSYIANCES